MALLKYDISVVGMSKVAQAFASIERRFAQHNSKVNALMRAGGASGGVAGTRGASAKPSELARGFDQIGRAARAADMKASRDRERAEQRLHQTRLRNIEKEAAAQIRAEQRAAAAAQRNALNSRRSFARGTMGALRGAAGTIAGIGKAGLALAGVGGGAAAGVAISAEMRERAKASQLANQAGNPALKGQLLQDARGVRGFTGEEALGGMEAFVAKTGDLDTARKIIGDLGTLSLATGANLEDLGETAGQAFNVLRDQIKDPKQQLIELNGIVTALSEQGNMGAVDIKDLARDFGKLGAATRGFEGGAPALLRTMGAFAQLAVARGGAEGSADASTASARLVGDIVTNKKRFKKLGVGIKSTTDPTKLRDPLEIMQDVLAKTGGDVEKTSGLFGIESAKIFKGLSAVYSEAEKTKKGSGRAAVDAEFKRFAGASLDPKALKERAASRLADPDVQFKETMKGLNAALGKELLPVASQLAGKLRDATPALGQFARKVADVVTWLANNPWKGVGAVVAYSLGKEIGGAGIKSVIERAIMGGGGKVPGAGGVGVGGLGAGGALATGAAGAAAVGGLYLAGDQASKLAAETGITSPGRLLDFIPGFKGGKFDTDNIIKEGLDPMMRASKYGGATEALLSALSPSEIMGRQDYAAKGGLKRAVGAGVGTAPGGVKLEGADTFSKAVADFGAKVSAMPGEGGAKPNRSNNPTP